jgi:hypothetical protein
MKRSAFLKAGTAAAMISGAAKSTSAQATGAGVASKGGDTREYFEVRRYTLKTPEKQALVDAYLRDAAIPALNKIGVKSVGVFYGEKPAPKPVIHVILRYATLDQLDAASQILSEKSLQQAGVAYLDSAAQDPVYERIESWLTRGIQSMPAMAVPAKGNKLYQLRIYESHSEKAARKKIEMFDIGELAIFKRCGMAPVFFGETVIGPLMPNLTYMLVFADQAAKDAGWKSFGGDPEWGKLKTTPGFTDKEIVSRITNIMLVPALYSQV